MPRSYGRTGGVVNLAALTQQIQDMVDAMPRGITHDEATALAQSIADEAAADKSDAALAAAQASAKAEADRALAAANANANSVAEAAAVQVAGTSLQQALAQADITHKAMGDRTKALEDRVTALETWKTATVTTLSALQNPERLTWSDLGRFNLPAIAVGVSTDVTIPWNVAAPDANYRVSPVVVGSTVITTTLKSKTTTSVTYTLKNTGTLPLAISTASILVLGTR